MGADPLQGRHWFAGMHAEKNNEADEEDNNSMEQLRALELFV